MTESAQLEKSEHSTTSPRSNCTCRKGEGHFGVACRLKRCHGPPKVASSAALEFISSEERGFWVNYGKGRPDEARLTRLLLDRGANHNVRASLRARLEGGHVGGPVHGVPET